MKLLITIDTEEDNWAKYSATDNPVRNINRLIPLQQLFDRFGVRPTYLISYPVATHPESRAILKSILGEGKCEIGMHCHPWNTPPFKEEINDVNSMLCNLPEQLILDKIRTLSQVIEQNFGVMPLSFRAGRWGLSPVVAKALHQVGCRVDTSVSPFVDWSEYHGPDYSTFQLYPYRFDPGDIKTPNDLGLMMEIPATVGFLQNNFERCQKWTRMLESTMGKKLRLKGLLYKLKLLNKVWLSPELCTANDMIKLGKECKRNGLSCLNMSFHSTSLLAGLSPFVQSKGDEVTFLGKIEEFLCYASEESFASITLAEFEASARL